MTLPHRRSIIPAILSNDSERCVLVPDIFERAGHTIARSTLAPWVGECGVQPQPQVDTLAAELRRQPVLHADETPVAMLKPGHGKTHRAYL